MIIHFAPRRIPGRGKADAFSIKNYGSRDNLLWIKEISESGKITSAPNHRISMQSNGTISRGLSPPAIAFECKAYPFEFRGEDNPSLKEVAR